MIAYWVSELSLAGQVLGLTLECIFRWYVFWLLSLLYVYLSRSTLTASSPMSDL